MSKEEIGCPHMEDCVYYKKRYSSKEKFKLGFRQNYREICEKEKTISFLNKGICPIADTYKKCESDMAKLRSSILKLTIEDLKKLVDDSSKLLDRLDH